MKRFFKLILVGLAFISIRGYSQNCPDDNTDITLNPYVCANSYGDANGNSSWDWESTPDNNPDYCKMWVARTSSQNNNQIEIMGSPFVNTRIEALYNISVSKDYTRAKGWELLTRNFGCSVPNSYPYFVLYNKYSGLARVYIYLPGTAAQYSGALLQVTSIKSPIGNSRFPALLAGGDDKIIAPDKYLSSDPSELTNSMFVVSQTAGSSNWSVAQFNPGFDLNIQDPMYKGSALAVVVYGVTKSDLTANITGTSVTAGKILDDISYKATTSNSTPTGSGIDGGKIFTATGEKIVKYSKSASSAVDAINKAAQYIYGKIEGDLKDEKFSNSTKGRIKGFASNVSNITKTLGMISSAAGAGGQAIGLLGTVIGMFSEGEETPAAAPTYTTYNLELHGEITTKVVTTSFILKIPGTIPDNSDLNNRNLATYYSCPMGLFNIKNTPTADVVKYERTTEASRGPRVGIHWSSMEKRNFVSYKLTNNLDASFNSGAGLELVSVQAAIVGMVLPVGKDNPNAVYDLLQEYYETTIGSYPFDYDHYSYNYMLPDLQAGILQVTKYDPDHNLHVFQTPYHDLGCLNGLVFNARAETNIFLRVKAILKKKNDPTNTAIYFIQDYKIQETEKDMDNDLRANLSNYDSYKYPTPYSNLPDVPLYKTGDVDKVINGVRYNDSREEVADNSITTENAVVVTSGQNVVFKAGSNIDLEEGFDTEENAEFEALLKMSQFNLTSCSTPVIDAFVSTINGGNCYNTVPSGLREATKPNDTEAVNGATGSEEVKVYPIPTTGKLVINGIIDSKNAVITILDQSGRTIRVVRPVSPEFSGRMDLDVSALQNGVYFVKIQTLTQTITKKIVVSK